MTTHARRWMVGAAAVVLAAVMGTGAALAASANGGRARQAARAYRTALGRVGLTPNQKARIRALAAKERPVLESLKGQRLISAAALQSALQAPNPDPATVGNALLKARADRMAVRAEVKRLRTETVSVLTPVQKAKLNGYLEALRAVQRRSRA